MFMQPRLLSHTELGQTDTTACSTLPGVCRSPTVDSPPVVGRPGRAAYRLSVCTMQQAGTAALSRWLCLLYDHDSHAVRSEATLNPWSWL